MLLEAMYELVERVTKAELTNAGRQLLIACFRSSPEEVPVLRALAAVRRSAQWDPPSMEEIRERNRAGAMEYLNRRVLRVENEARWLREAERRA